MEKFSTSIKSHKLESRWIEFFYFRHQFLFKWNINSSHADINTFQKSAVLLALQRLGIILYLDLHVSKTYIMPKIHIIPDNYRDAKTA